MPVKALEPESSASTNFATFAGQGKRRAGAHRGADHAASCAPCQASAAIGPSGSRARVAGLDTVAGLVYNACVYQLMPNLASRRPARSWLRLDRALLACVLALGLCVALPVRAVEPDKAAAGLARQGAQAEDAGDAAAAARLYLQAYETDPRQPNYLYAAARAELQAGRRAEAEEHFEQFLAVADSGTDRADKARAYLADLRASRSQDKAAAAEAAAAAGRWAEASQRYETLWQQQPTRWSALFKAGAAAQDAGQTERAAELLDQYLREAPKTAADRPEAEDRLRQVRRAGGGATEGVSQPQSTGRPGPSVAGWTLVGGGIALVAGGVAMLLVGTGEAHALERDLKIVDGYVTADITHAQAQTRADQAALHQNLGLGLGAAGVVAAAVGTWLVLREPEGVAAAKVTVAPGPALAGLALGWRF